MFKTLVKSSIHGFVWRSKASLFPRDGAATRRGVLNKIAVKPDACWNHSAQRNEVITEYFNALYQAP